MNAYKKVLKSVKALYAIKKYKSYKHKSNKV